MRDTLRLVQEGKFDGCIRGLERLRDNGRTRERRKLSIRDVLDEQEIQRAHARATHSYVYDDKMLRKVYRLHSRAARFVAHAMGKIDAMAVKHQRILESRNYERNQKKRKVIACLHA